MDIHRGDYILIKRGLITQVIDVMHITHTKNKEIIEDRYVVYTPARKKPYSMEEILDYAKDEEELKKKKETR